MTFRALVFGMALGFVAAVMPSCGGVKPVAKCNSTSCATGCCGSDGECYTGVSPQACGTGAATCLECFGNSPYCVDGQCRASPDGGSGGGAGGSGGSGGTGGTGGAGGSGGGTGSCSPSTCDAGCCTGNGVCQTVTSTQACGKNGGACVTCGFGQTCAAGTCSATSCATCRDGAGNCLDGGNSDNACGASGGLCVRCDTANGQRCNGGQCTGGSCNANNCSDGCCAAGTCVRDGGVAQCGTGGVVCNSCSGSTAQCVNGQCTGSGGGDGGLNLDGGFGTCDLSSCATGCCVQGLGICMPGTDDLFCGTGAGNCDACLFQLKTCDQVSHTCK